MKDIKFDISRLFGESGTLSKMGVGLIGIFMIIGIIIAATYAIGYATRYIGKGKDNENK